MKELPLYQCHKKVRAAKIIITTGMNNGGACIVVDVPDPACPVQGNINLDVDAAWLARNPALAVGGYFVEYEDGYTAYSPAAPFEGGYTLIPGPVYLDEHGKAKG